uniref:Uncharacterized protein n=1 Tax=Strix occidentalis caurina TaxID=311401 RepID=A0A8D0F5A9_STROC
MHLGQWAASLIISENYCLSNCCARRTPRFSFIACFLTFWLGGNCQIHLSLLLNLRHEMMVYYHMNYFFLFKITDFRRMSALEELVLSCSGTESIENNTFKALSTLKSLELYKNQLKQIPTLLPSGLEILKLADNSINTLHVSDFEGLMKLRVLDIRNNMIASLPPSAFSSLCNLQSLILDGNNMESVSAPLKLPRLKYLSMADNKLNSFPTNFFKNQLKTVRLRDMKHLENLSEFFLSENQLTSVDGAQLLPNLTTLDLTAMFNAI